MQERDISENEIDEALAHIHMTNTTPKGSTCIVGNTVTGRSLKIWIVGESWPPTEPLVVKSVAPRGE